MTRARVLLAVLGMLLALLPFIQAHPAIASVGEELSFTGPDGGLWLGDAARGPFRLLLANGEFTAYAWSPDGRRIAYRAADGGLGILDPPLGRRTRVAEPSIDGFSWSPDSERIALVRDQQLWIVPVRGGPMVRATDHSTAEGDRILPEPVWAGDSRSVYYGIRRFRAPADVGVYELSSRRARLLPVGRSGGAIDGPVPAPDGRTLVVPFVNPADPTEATCVKGSAPARDGASSGAVQVLEILTLPALERQRSACWSLTDDDGVMWMSPVFVQDGAIMLMPAAGAPGGLMALDRESKPVDPRSLGLWSTAEEAGRVVRRYPTELVTDGRMVALAYRQDEPMSDGMWFSYELHLVDTASTGPARRTVLLRDGCLCPGDDADTNIADLRLSPDGARVAITLFQGESNVVAIVGVDGEVKVIADGERPVWRPRR